LEDKLPCITGHLFSVSLLIFKYQIKIKILYGLSHNFVSLPSFYVLVNI